MHLCVSCLSWSLNHLKLISTIQNLSNSPNVVPKLAPCHFTSNASDDGFDLSATSQPLYPVSLPIVHLFTSGVALGFGLWADIVSCFWALRGVSIVSLVQTQLCTLIASHPALLWSSCLSSHFAIVSQIGLLSISISSKVLAEWNESAKPLQIGEQPQWQPCASQLAEALMVNL